MLINIPPSTHRRRTRCERRAVAAPVGPPPELTAAVFTLGSPVNVTLTFDQPVNIDAIDVTAVLVDDGVTSHTSFVGQGAATLLSPTQVRVPMVANGSIPAGLRLLNALTGAGIVAADDGAAWPGVFQLQLPFP